MFQLEQEKGLKVLKPSKKSTETLEATESATAEAEATADSWGLKYHNYI